jgi:hypothetical protein
MIKLYNKARLIITGNQERVTPNTHKAIHIHRLIILTTIIALLSICSSAYASDITNEIEYNPWIDEIYAPSVEEYIVMDTHGEAEGEIYIYQGLDKIKEFEYSISSDSHSKSQFIQYELLLHNNKFIFADRTFLPSEISKGTFTGDIVKNSNERSIDGCDFFVDLFNSSYTYYDRLLDCGSNTIVYCDSDYIYVTSFDNTQNVKKTKANAETVHVSGDGGTIFYNYRKKIFKLNNGITEEIGTGSFIVKSSYDGNELYYYDSYTNSLMLYAATKTQVIAKDVVLFRTLGKDTMQVVFTKSSSENNYDLYYYDLSCKSPILIDTIDAMLSYAVIDVDSKNMFNNYENSIYISYNKFSDDKLHYAKASNKGVVKTRINTQDTNGYDFENNIVYTLDEENNTKINCYDLDTGKVNQITTENDIMHFTYKDGILLYTDSNNITSFVNEKTEYILFNDPNHTYQILNNNSILYCKGSYDKKEYYVYRLSALKFIYLGDNVQDIEITQDAVYALMDYDESTNKGSVYALSNFSITPYLIEKDINHIYKKNDLYSKNLFSYVGE